MFQTKYYLAICEWGHRSYLRLALIEPDAKGRCKKCGHPAELFLLPPPR